MNVKEHHRRRMTKEKILLIPEMSKTLRIPQIAEEFGVSVRTINDYIRVLRAEGHTIYTTKVTGPLPVRP